jgi:type I restriction enzyme S subunit
MGWEIKKLGEVCGKITDGSHNPPKGVNFSTYRMLSSQNIFNGYIDYDAGVRYLTKEDFEIEDRRTNLQVGDVLMTIVGTIGRTCIVSSHDTNVTLQRSVAVLRPNNAIISKYLSYFIMSINSVLNRAAHGIAQKGIYLKQLSNFTIPLPPLSLQQSFAAKVSAIEAQKQAVQQSIREVEALLAERMDNYFG